MSSSNWDGESRVRSASMVFSEDSRRPRRLSHYDIVHLRVEARVKGDSGRRPKRDIISRIFDLEDQLYANYNNFLTEEPFFPKRLKWEYALAWLESELVEGATITTNLKPSQDSVSWQESDIIQSEGDWSYQVSVIVSNGRMPRAEDGEHCLVFYITYPQTPPETQAQVTPELGPLVPEPDQPEPVVPAPLQEPPHLPVLPSEETADDNEIIVVGDQKPDDWNDRGLDSYSQYNEDDWQNITTMLLMDEDAQVYTVRGTGLALSDYQVMAVGWMLLQSQKDRVPGAILADDMGLGKTIETIAFFVLKNMLLRNWDEVQAEWARGDDFDDLGREEARRDHLERHTRDAPQEENATCPTQNQRGIQCCCVRRGVAYRVARRLADGPNLVICPAGLINNWADEFDRYIPKDSRLSDIMRLYSTHEALQGTDHALGNEQVRAIRAVPTDIETTSKSSTLEKEKVWTYNLQKPANASGVVLLVSNAGLEGLERRFLAQVPKPNHQRAMIEVNTLAVGTVAMDEFHTYKGRSSLTLPFKFLQTQRRRAAHDEDPLRPAVFLIAISGTPITVDMKDVIQVATHIEETSTAPGTESFWHGGADLVGELRRVHELHGKATRGVDADDTAFLAGKKSFLQKFVIRRHKQDRFRGQAILDSKKCEVRVVDCKTPVVYRESIQEMANMIKAFLADMYESEMSKWKGGEAKPTKEKWLEENMIAKAAHSSSSDWHKLRQAAIFPALAEIENIQRHWRPEDKLSFDMEEATRVSLALAQDRSHAKVEGLFRKSGWWKHRDALKDSSTMMAELQRIIAEMCNREDKRQHPKDGSRVCHMAVWTISPLTAFLTLMILVPEYPDVEFIYLHRGVKVSGSDPVHTRSALVEKVQRPCTDQSRNKVVVGNYHIGGIGFNMWRANYCVMVGMPLLLSEQEQTIGRVNRRGQELDLNVTQLVNLNNPAERATKERWDKRHILNFEDVWRVGDDGKA